MRKIKYPSSSLALSVFEKDYYNGLNKSKLTNINAHLALVNYPKGTLTLEILVKLKFNELVDLESDIKDYSEKLDVYKKVNNKIKRTNVFEDLFDYKKNHKHISSFFMQQDCFNLKICHYCGIDYINAFVDLDDYEDKYDFLNRANVYDLQILYGFGEPTALKFIRQRKGKRILSLSGLGLRAEAKAQLNSFDFKAGHNHFTLDHVLPQKTHKFYSLCLYNFVPSCYPCNSKFKKAIEFDVIDNNLKNISPSSSTYSFSDDFKFQLYFNGKLDTIKTENDFVLRNNILRNRRHIEKYLAMFKIGGRYTFHKDKVLDLIHKKVKYPSKRIKEISKTTGISRNEVKNMLFGEELFNGNGDEPFVKLKRDVAKSIGLKNVK